MIHFEQRGFVGLATIDRQERRNALNGDLCDQLGVHLLSHPDLRAVVITLRLLFGRRPRDPFRR